MNRPCMQTSSNARRLVDARRQRGRDGGATARLVLAGTCKFASGNAQRAALPASAGPAARLGAEPQEQCEEECCLMYQRSLSCTTEWMTA